MGLARHFFQKWPGDCVGTLPTPLGVRCFARDVALRLIDATNEKWKENATPEADTLLSRVKKRLIANSPTQTGPVASEQSRSYEVISAVSRMLNQLACGSGRLASSVLPRGSLYVNTGQIGIASPVLLFWLRRRPDVKPVFMLHDTIPIDLAEFVPPSSPAFHQSMIASTARHAAGLIVTTDAAESSIRRELKRCGRADIPIFSENPPVTPIFALGADHDAELDGVPYFVITGTIEPRKNHLFLLHVWRELVQLEGKAAPKLVVVGTRWRRFEGVTDILERSSVLKDHVIEVSGLSTPGLRRLVSSACGLLMPSFAEGFGSPIIEALALGTPVIASDLPAHREAGGPYATYLSPIDGVGWLAAIRSHVQQRSALRAKLANYQVRTWDQYLRRLDPFLLSLHAGATQALGSVARLEGTAAE
jgi:glycosyltransferase involved in cell wall biosynthesis